MKLPSQFLLRRDWLMAAALVAVPTEPAFAKYGEFAKMDGSRADFTVGDSANECLFAQPGTGVCTVYKSSDPTLWAEPDQGRALAKLVGAAKTLNGLGASIEKQQWTAITQTLGASRDLREAVGFLTSNKPEAAKKSKEVFKALDGIALAAQKKLPDTAKQYFDKYTQAMPALLSALE